MTKLRELTGGARLRKVELLSYLEGLVYHSREEKEHQWLRRFATANDLDSVGIVSASCHSP